MRILSCMIKPLSDPYSTENGMGRMYIFLAVPKNGFLQENSRKIKRGNKAILIDKDES
jgi:hypothetical protein